MQKTIQDLKKATTQGEKIFKGFFYYGFIPIILVLGIKTVDWQQLSNPQQM